MYLQPTQTVQQAFHHLQHLPKVEQKQVFSLIDSLLLKHNVQQENQVKADEPSELQKKFLAWQAQHQAMLATLEDDMTDEEFNEIWDNLRDKNDTGREVNFE